MPVSFLASYSHVCFDLDGTLARLRVDWAAVRAEVARALFPTPAEVPGGGSLSAIFTHLAEAGDADRLARFLDILRAFEQPDGTAAWDPVAEGLRLLAAAPCASVITNNLTGTALQVLSAVAPGRVLPVVGLDRSLRLKPHRRAYDILVASVDLGTSALYVGDRDTDRQFAEACGMDFLDIRDAAGLSLGDDAPTTVTKGLP